MYANDPKWGNGNPPSDADRSLDILQAELPDAVVSELGEGMTSFPYSPFPFKSVWNNWSDPDITALKWACLQVAVALMSSPFIIIPITQSMILDLTMTGTFLE